MSNYDDNDDLLGDIIGGAGTLLGGLGGLVLGGLSAVGRGVMALSGENNEYYIDEGSGIEFLRGSIEEAQELFHLFDRFFLKSPYEVFARKDL